ncbi:hypothetical protein [Streptomyces sp. NPDC050287]|uniref:hypothetical protein n=1 Tax=Streptomyces sp. NPDC050287 TaxID=3365608 RepID=UPI003789634F
MFLVLFLLPLAWGLITLAQGRATPVAPHCDGLQLGADGEETPSRMRRGFTCYIDYSLDGRSAGTRTYDQQKYAQERERSRYYLHGTLYIAYGTAGLVVLASAGGLPHTIRRRLPHPRRPTPATRP